jgi:hypothetical protein
MSIKGKTDIRIVIDQPMHIQLYIMKLYSA